MRRILQIILTITFGIGSCFQTVVCAEDTAEHKPNPAPLLKYMEQLSGAASDSNAGGIYLRADDERTSSRGRVRKGGSSCNAKLSGFQGHCTSIIWDTSLFGIPHYAYFAGENRWKKKFRESTM